jgi:reverse gyrase
MEEEFPILPAIIGLLALTFFGFEVERRRNKLRSIFDVFDKKESKIAEALEMLVESGQLKPYVPPDHTVRLAAE